MKMYVYKIKDGIEVENWDDVNFQRDCIVCAVITGNDNAECERKATDNGYDNTEVYGWTYNDDIVVPADVVLI